MGLKNLVGGLLAPAYGDTIREVSQKPVILGMLETGECVLDLGSGSGLYTRHVKAGKCIALDYSRENIGKTMRASRAFGAQGDAQNLPFKKDSFDTVLCFEVLEHLKEDGRALQEVKRVLKPGGELFLSVPLKPAPIEDKAHVREGYTPEELKRLLEENGFRVKEEKYCFLFFSRIAFKLIGYCNRKMKFRPPVLAVKGLAGLDALCLGKKTWWRPFDLVVRAGVKV